MPLTTGINYCLTSRLAAVCAGMLLLAGTAMAQGAPGNGAPVEIEAVGLRQAQDGVDLLIDAERAVVWRSERQADGALVILIDHSVPGPEALDLNPRTGLVAAVEVGFSIESGTPMSRIVVRGRRPFVDEIVGEGDLITVQLRSGEPSIRTAAAQPQETRPPQPEPRRQLPVRGAATVESPADRELVQARQKIERLTSEQEGLQEALTQARSQTETFRQRAAALHEDRLQLVAQLREARERLDGQTNGNATTGEDAARTRELEGLLNSARQEGESLRRQLAQAQQAVVRLEEAARSNQQQDSESARIRGQLDTTRNELVVARQNAATAQETAREEAGRRKQAEDRARLMAEQLDQAQRDLQAAEQTASAAAQSVGERALERRIDELQRAEATMRSWLMRAPSVLGAGTLRVSDNVSPCLNVRPQPTTTGKTLDCAPPGTEVEVLNMRPDWLRVRLPNTKEGWVAQRFLQPVGRVGRTEYAALERRNQELSEQLQAAAAERREQTERIEALARNQQEMDEIRRALDEANAGASKLREERDSLAQQVAEAAAERVAASRGAGQLAALREELDGLQRDRDRLQQQLQQEIENHATLRGTYTELEAKLAASENGKRKLEQRLVATQSSLAKAETAGGELRETRAALAQREDALADAAGRIEQLNEQLSEQTSSYQQRIDSLEREAEGKQLAWQEEKARLESMIAEATGADVPRTKVNADVEPCLLLRERPNTESDKVDCLPPGTNLSVLGKSDSWFAVAVADGRRGWAASAYLEPPTTAAHDDTAAEINRLRAELGAATDARDSAEARVLGLEQEMSQSRQQREQLEASLAAARQAVEGTQQESASLRERLATVGEEAERLREGLAERASDSGSEAAERQALEDDRDRLAGRLETADRRIAELESGSGALRQQLKTAQEEQARLVEELTGARNELMSLQAEIAADTSSRDVEITEARVAELEQEAASLRRELEASQALADSARIESEASIAALEAQHDQARRQLETLTAEREQALQQVDVAAQPVAPAEPLGQPIPVAPAEPLSAEPVFDPSDELKAVAADWSRAWSDQNVEDYLSFYAAAFEPADGMPRQEWVEQRRIRLLRPAFIQVALSDVTTRVDSEDRAAVLFTQAYRSNTYQDRVTKTLEMAREGGQWKILREISE